jgi:osmotically inducible lipoprotein OsmB
MHNSQEMTMNSLIRKISAVGAATLVAAALGGCAGMDHQDRSTIGGAAIGGVAGNVLGGGAVGTVGGAAVGGVIGPEVGKK